MDFEEYVRTLQVVHDEGKAHQLNAHFLPQQFGCFRDLAPQNGSIAAPITNRDFVRALDRSLGNASASLPHVHSSRHNITISETANAILKHIMEREYGALQFVF